MAWGSAAEQHPLLAVMVGLLSQIREGFVMQNGKQIGNSDSPFGNETGILAKYTATK